MRMEDEVFQKMELSFEKLVQYGFLKKENFYIYSKTLMDGFLVLLQVSLDKVVTGKIIDLALGEEYTNFRIKKYSGEFVNTIRLEYKKLLEDIAEACGTSVYFRTSQANRIANKIIKEYQAQPEFLWDSSPDHAIFRHKDNQKWFALIAYVDKSKLDQNASGMVEILNLKIKEEQLTDILKQTGFYKAWHMNKKTWITIILDETIPDIEVLKYIKNSYIYTSS